MKPKPSEGGSASSLDHYPFRVPLSLSASARPLGPHGSRPAWGRNSGNRKMRFVFTVFLRREPPSVWWGGQGGGDVVVPRSYSPFDGFLPTCAYATPFCAVVGYAGRGNVRSPHPPPPNPAATIHTHIHTTTHHHPVELRMKAAKDSSERSVKLGC